MFDEKRRAGGCVEAYQGPGPKRAVYPGERNIARYFRLGGWRVVGNHKPQKERIFIILFRGRKHSEATRQTSHTLKFYKTETEMK